MKTRAPLTILLLVLLCTGAAWAQFTGTCITLTPPVVQQGNSTTATGTTQLNPTNAICAGGTPVSDGNQTLQEAKDGLGQPTSCALGSGFISGSPVPVDLNGQASFSPDTSTLGTFGYRIAYSGGVEPPSVSPCLDLAVVQSCSGVNIAADLASGDGNPPAGVPEIWTVEIKVHACQDALIQKAQGGNNGWATNSVTSVSQGSYTIKDTGNSNQVITWNVGSLGGNSDATMLLTVSGTIKRGTPSGTVVGLTGPWSVTYSIDGGHTYQKSDYTGRITVTVR